MKRDLMHLGIKKEKIKVLHSGVDLGRFDIPVTKDQARLKIGFSLDKFLVVYAGQLFPEKGVDTLVKAACLLDGVEVLIVGGASSDIARVEKLKRQMGAINVTIKGHVKPEQVPFFLRAADCLVLPNSKDHVLSAYHTSPMKLFEYMASGRIIVASDLPAVREVLKHGDNGWLVEPDNPQALAEGIRHLLEDKSLTTQLSAKAYEDVKGYTWKIRSREIMRLTYP
jgi:glycosyltransferase involved in cell wall biosynthesis